MGIIYKPNILKYRSADNLYYTPTFQKSWHVTDLIYFIQFNGKANSSSDPNDTPYPSAPVAIKLCTGD